MRDIWDYTVNLFKNYLGNGQFGWLFLACLLFLLLWKKRGKVRNILLWPSLLLLFLLFCPLTAKVIMKLIGQDIYWRTYWMLPILLLAAYVGTEIVFLLRGRGKQFLVWILCAALIAASGSFVFTDNYFTERENLYKLPGEVIAVADVVREHAEKNQVRKKLVGPTGISTYIRIYDASILQRYGRNTTNGHRTQTELFDQINSDHPDHELLVQRARMGYWKYIVLMKKADNEEAMEAMNCEKIYDGSSYVVYYDWNKKARS